MLTMSADIIPGKYQCLQSKTEYGVEAIPTKSYEVVDNLQAYLTAKKVRIICNSKYGACPTDCRVKQLQKVAAGNLKSLAENIINDL